LEKENYFYRVNYPKLYQSPALYINKFEKDFQGQYLQYRFLQAYPISISSMPVSYDSSQILKCTVSFTYTRYVINRNRNRLSEEPQVPTPPGVPNPNSINQKYADLYGNDYVYDPASPGNFVDSQGNPVILG